MWVNTAVSWECKQWNSKDPRNSWPNYIFFFHPQPVLKNRMDLIQQVYPIQAPRPPWAKGKYTTVLKSACDGSDWRKIKAKNKNKKGKTTPSRRFSNLQAAELSGWRTPAYWSAVSLKKGPNSLCHSGLWDLWGLRSCDRPISMIPKDSSNILTAEKRWRRRLAQI